MREQQTKINFHIGNAVFLVGENKYYLVVGVHPVRNTCLLIENNDENLFILEKNMSELDFSLYPLRFDNISNETLNKYESYMRKLNAIGFETMSAVEFIRFN